MSQTTDTRPPDNTELATCANPFDHPEPPDRITVVPWGDVASSAGNFHVDAEAAAAVIEAFARHGTDLPIDFEHQTLGGTYASPQGTAPAAGWITDLTAVPDQGIVATVNWTTAGRQQLGDRAYRYLSPVVIVRKSDRRIVGLHSAALTNKPAIVGMTPLVHRATADRAALTERLALDPATDPAEILAAANHRIDALESAARDQAATTRVNAAVNAGKLTPAQRDWATRLALRDPDLFDEWSATAPVVVALGSTTPPAERSTTRHVRAEYRANPLLQQLTSEEAYVSNARRSA